MTVYIDSSAYLKLYVDEPDSEECRRFLSEDARWSTANHTLVELRRNLVRMLSGKRLEDAGRFFAEDWRRTEVVLLDVGLCNDAAAIAERTLVRALDALHLAAAARVKPRRFLTYDGRQAEAARRLGLNVAGT